MKKIFTLILAGLLIFALAACDTEETPVQSSDDAVVEDVDVNDDESSENDATASNEQDISYDQSMDFNGYKIGYPDGAITNISDYGELMDYEEFVLVIEAPSTVGIMLDVASVEDAPSVCEEYLMNTLEGRIRKLFDYDKTVQEIVKSEVVDNNGIEMLRTEGMLKNTYENTETEYVGYYFMSNSGYPIYMIGFSIEETDASVAEFVDGIAENITK